MMLISGVGFSVVCGVSLSGAVDKGAEELGWCVSRRAAPARPLCLRLDMRTAGACSVQLSCLVGTRASVLTRLPPPPLAASMHLAFAMRSQEKGEYAKWSSKNEFQIKDLVDVDDFVEDVKDETSWMVDWKKGGEDGEDGGEEGGEAKKNE